MISSILSFPLAFALVFGGGSVPAKKHDPRIAPLAAVKLPPKGKGKPSSGLVKSLGGKGAKTPKGGKKAKTAKTVKTGPKTKKTIRHGR